MVCIRDKMNGVLNVHRPVVFAGMFFFALFIYLNAIAFGQQWDDIRIRLLTDTSFALIEYDIGSAVRHCPHHDLNGRLDVDQLIYELGTLDAESWINPGNKETARNHLERHFNAYLKKARKRYQGQPFNINEARLSDLVNLPLIGPVTAVKIVKFRNEHLRYQSIDQLKNVEGIGPGIFTAIRHYVRVD